MCKSILYIITIALCIGTLSACKKVNNSIPEIKVRFLGKINYKTKIPCEVNLTQNDNQIKLRGSIKLRGGYSRIYPKHSFSLELKSPYPLCGLPTDDDWILNANYIDKTFLRHKLNYDLFRLMSPDNKSAQCTYFNFKVDTSNRGLYVLMQEINGSMLGIDKSDSMAMVFKDPPLFYTEKLAYVQDTSNYYQQKYPKKKKSDKTAYIESFIDFIFNSTDSLFASEIEQWVDLDNIMDWQILLLLANNGDGVMKNFYFYKIDSETPFRVAPWDYDHSFGREGDYEKNMLARKVYCERSILIKRLMAVQGLNYVEHLIDRWKSLRQTLISIEHLTEMMDKNCRIIANDLNNNFEIWPTDSKWYFDANTNQEEVDLIKTYFVLRIKDLDSYFEDLKIGGASPNQ